MEITSGVSQLPQNKESLQRVLVIAGGFPPGFKSGGPVRSITNLVEWLGDEYDFYVLALDRDSGDIRPYEGITPGIWTRVGKANVLYLPLRDLSFRQWYKLLKTTPSDFIYQYSFFDRTSLRTVLLTYIGLLKPSKLIVAPHGEFSPGALSLKAWKKRLFIQVVKMLRTHSHVIWQATSEFERSDIEAIMGYQHIIVAPNMPSPAYSSTYVRLPKSIGQVRIIFLSRITRMKNLDYALNLLRQIDVPVQFDVFGPEEDMDYWQECQRIIEQMPANVTVRYCGVIEPQNVIPTFANYDMLLLPTLGENFSYVILEALSAGCVLLISDRTPWRNLVANSAGWDLPLDNPSAFLNAINTVASLDPDQFERMSRSAIALAHQYINSIDLLNSMRQLLNAGDK